MPNVLVVEDDLELGQLLVEYLTEEGMKAAVERDGTRAVDRILVERPDLVLLDLNLPGSDGFEVHRRVRPHFGGVILVLTARRSDLDHVAALEMGADDYVTKPIDPRVLFARIKAHLRRVAHAAATAEPARVAVGAIEVDRTLRRVTVAGAVVEVTGLEFEILWYLARAAGRVVTRERMYEDVLGTRYDGLDRGIDSHVSRVRRKLREAGLRHDAIVGVRGQGYQLVPE